MRRSWPRALSFMLGIIPVLLLLLVIGVAVWFSSLTFYRVGWGELFSFYYQNYRQGGWWEFGLLPSIMGTLYVVLLALAISLPVSLAIAVYASEYASGAVGRVLRTILGTLAGIPPIIYGLTSFIFLGFFVSPSFTRVKTVVDLAAPPLHPILDQQKSAILGGIMLALMIIPFMAPLIDEAIRNVPARLKEASLALGAGKWHTIGHIILPHALPGIIGACALGCFKAMGDLIIVAFTCRSNGQLPQPWWDVSNLSPLTGTIGWLSGILYPALLGKNDLTLSVSYFSTLVLLGMALIVLGLATLLQRWFRKKYTA